MLTQTHTRTHTHTNEQKPVSIERPNYKLMKTQHFSPGLKSVTETKTGFVIWT